MNRLSVEPVLEQFPCTHLRELATFGALSDECILQLLAITGKQFFELNSSAPEHFGLLMINLSRGMARTISILGDVITDLRH